MALTALESARLYECCRLKWLGGGALRTGGEVFAPERAAPLSCRLRSGTTGARPRPTEAVGALATAPRGGAEGATERYYPGGQYQYWY